MEESSTIYRPPPSIAEAMGKVQTKRELAALFKHLRLRAKKGLGQSFLVDHNLLDFMVRAGEVGPEDVALDIGCGTGLLTAHLADAAGRVVAIELDRALFAICSRYLAGRANVTLLWGDALASKHALSPALLEAVEKALAEKTPAVFCAEHPEGRGRQKTAGVFSADTGGTPVPPALVAQASGLCATGKMPAPPRRTAEGGCATRTLRVVSNLPYSAASMLVPNLLESGLPIASMAVTVQKEVADRMAASPGSEGYGALSLIVQAHAAVEVLRRVPAEVFWPRPKVVSAIVRVAPDPARRAGIRDYGAFRQVVRAAFAHRRKTLANSLAASGLLGGQVEDLLAACGLAPNARAESLGLETYLMLANQLGSLGLGGRRVEDEDEDEGRGRL